MGKHLETLGVIKGSKIVRVVEDIYMTPAMRRREKALSRQKDESQQVRGHLDT